jgi:hypothetical protein
MPAHEAPARARGARARAQVPELLVFGDGRRRIAVAVLAVAVVGIAERRGRVYLCVAHRASSLEADAGKVLEKVGKRDGDGAVDVPRTVLTYCPSERVTPPVRAAVRVCEGVAKRTTRGSRTLSMRREMSDAARTFVGAVKTPRRAGERRTKERMLAREERASTLGRRGSVRLAGACARVEGGVRKVDGACGAETMRKMGQEGKVGRLTDHLG